MAGPGGGKGDVRLARTKASARLAVLDDGPVICESERAMVGQRFLRSRNASEIEEPDLGLVSGSAITKLHDFEFATRPCEAGTRHASSLVRLAREEGAGN